MHGDDEGGRRGGGSRSSRGSGELDQDNARWRSVADEERAHPHPTPGAPLPPTTSPPNRSSRPPSAAPARPSSRRAPPRPPSAAPARPSNGRIAARRHAADAQAIAERDRLLQMAREHFTRTSDAAAGGPSGGPITIRKGYKTKPKTKNDTKDNINNTNTTILSSYDAAAAKRPPQRKRRATATRKQPPPQQQRKRHQQQRWR